MTTFAAWVGVDERKPASVYFASDSRISWGPQLRWDRGRKLFASRTSPDLLGYVGDVLFPSLALAQVTSLIEAGAMFTAHADPGERFARIQTSVKASFTFYPEAVRQPFTIVYATRESELMESSFHIYTLAWFQHVGWKGKAIPIPDRSSVLCALGSGEAAFSEWQVRWEATSEGGTSRGIFSAFCDALHNKEDPLTGGAPQLVGIYRKGPGRGFGVIYDENPFLFGMPVDKSVASNTTGIEWRNRLFERCDEKGQLLDKAKKHNLPEISGRTE